MKNTPIPSLPFQPIPLCLDDVLPVHMLLLMGYDYSISTPTLLESLDKALKAFPHFSGRIHFNLEPLEAAFVPSEHPVHVETNQVSDCSLEKLKSLSQDSIKQLFAPTASHDLSGPMEALMAPLLQIRLTQLENNQSILCLMVSHMLVDGVGMGIFLNQMTSHLNNSELIEPIHDRQVTYPTSPPQNSDLPNHYYEVPEISLNMAQPKQGEPKPTVQILAISLKSIQNSLQAKSMNDAKMIISAHLCKNVSHSNSQIDTIAMWCGTRGLSNIPKNYTGNTGCYTHTSLEGNPEEIYSQLKKVTTRQGFKELSASYKSIKFGESQGKLVFWGNPAQNLLSLNIVPHICGVANFGQGEPQFTQLLTRNVAGIRVYNTPDCKQIMIEACLPKKDGATLLSYCQSLNLDVEEWHISKDNTTKKQ